VLTVLGAAFLGSTILFYLIVALAGRLLAKPTASEAGEEKR
jgi:hypothetical protein